MLTTKQRLAVVAAGGLAAAAATSAVVLAPSATAASMTFAPAADTYVSSNATSTNYGTATAIGVDASEVNNAFLRFDLSSVTGSITSAKLRLHVDDTSSAASSSGGTFKLMSNTTWSETGVTYSAAPAIDGATLGTIGAVTRNSWVELDLTGKIQGGSVISIGATSSSTDGADYDSREAGSSVAPQLVVETGGSTPSASPSPTATATTTATPTASPTSSADPVLVGAGDIATSATSGKATADLIKAMPDATVFAAGDLAYDSGTAAEFNNYYNPTWGAFKNRTYPAPGNHEYNTSNASGYYSYWGSRGAGVVSGQGYYSYDLGNWHVVVLNSEISRGAGSAQETWLRQDLAANTRPCTLAYWHKPLFTSSSGHAPDTSQRPLYQALYDYDAEVVVTGHNHQYERFAAQNPTGGADSSRGIVQFVAGMGGAGFYGWGTTQPNSVARNNNTKGVLKFTLHDNSADFAFVPEAGKTYSDSGNIACH